MLITFEDSDKYKPEKVLERISDISIYEYYMNERIKPGDLYKCCFHTDKVPSLGFKRMQSDMLIYNCFSCGAKGGVFDFVSKVRNISYKEAVHEIVDSFESNKTTQFKRPSQVEDVFYDVKKIIIRPYSKPFNSVDVKY